MQLFITQAFKQNTMHITRTNKKYIKSSFNKLNEHQKNSIPDSIVKSGLPRSRSPLCSYFRHQSPYQKYLLDLHYIDENCQISRLHIFTTVGQRVPNTFFQLQNVLQCLFLLLVSSALILCRELKLNLICERVVNPTVVIKQTLFFIHQQK
jgi:hypothetical protein